MVIVRAATDSDLPKLSRLWHEKMILQQPNTRFKLAPDAATRWIEAVSPWLHDERCEIIAADSDGALVGYIIGWIQDAPPGLLPEKVGVVTDVMIDAHFARGGIGTMLLDTLRQWFANHDIVDLMAYVPSRFPVEHAFWQAQGAADWMNIVWLK
jgi:GNAT superfamily N-acetyltransferase